MDEISQQRVWDPLRIPATITIFPGGYNRFGWMVMLLVMTGLTLPLFFLVDGWLPFLYLLVLAPFDLYYLLLIVPNSTRIRVTPGGISVRHLFCEHFYEWKSVRNFSVDYHFRCVHIDVIPGAEPTDLVSRFWQHRNPRYPLPTGGWILEAFSLELEELADLLNTCRFYYSVELGNDNLSEDSEAIETAISKITRTCKSSTSIQIR